MKGIEYITKPALKKLRGCFKSPSPSSSDDDSQSVLAGLAQLFEQNLRLQVTEGFYCFNPAGVKLADSVAALNAGHGSNALPDLQIFKLCSAFGHPFF